MTITRVRKPTRRVLEAKGKKWVITLERDRINIKPYRKGLDTTTWIQPAQLYCAAMWNTGPTERERRIRRAQ